VLFAALLLAILGYTMVFSALHGSWAFWKYFFPKQTAQGQPAVAA
jgi:hypothetical protein